MDDYTRQTQEWLDHRYMQTDDGGVYVAHQPIYGFRRGPHERGLIPRYIRTAAILRALSVLEFSTLLDVGGAEGYTANLIRTFFPAQVSHCDLSAEASKRAVEIYGLDSRVADVHALPYGENQFDVLLCSESLEHVSHPEVALTELLRVAKRAVVITVPHESEAEVHANQEAGVEHGHIHAFDINSFGHLAAHDWTVQSEKLVSPVSRVLGALIDAAERPATGGLARRMAIKIFNVLRPIARALTGAWTVRLMVARDPILCRAFAAYEATIFVIRKDSQSPSSTSPKPSMRQILSVTVPLHQLDSSMSD